MRKLIHRVLWQVNRSPVGPVIKKSLRLFHKNGIDFRSNLAQQLSLQPEWQACVDQIARDGYSVVTHAIDQNLLKEIGAAGQQKLQVAERAAKQQSQMSKAFWTRLLDEDMQNGKLPTSNPFVRFAIQPSVTAILSRAFGEVPRLDYVLLTLSHPKDGELKQSQLWHRDHDDTRVIKLFVYLSDVTGQQDGPFTMIPGPISDRFGYNRKSHRTDADIFGSGNATAADVESIIAPALSVFMVETSRCLHMGSRIAPGHARLLYTANYATVPCMFPNRINRFYADVPFRDNVEKALLDL
jgi:hypothetical protein